MIGARRALKDLGNQNHHIGMLLKLRSVFICRVYLLCLAADLNLFTQVAGSQWWSKSKAHTLSHTNTPSNALSSGGIASPGWLRPLGSAR